MIAKKLTEKEAWMIDFLRSMGVHPVFVLRALEQHPLTIPEERIEYWEAIVEMRTGQC